MRFNSIKINNYRQYKEIEFNFPKKSYNDLHIIIGQNGIGKTNILNAVTWCLYGVEPHLGDESRSLPKYNLESKKELLMNSEEIVNIDVKILAEVSGKFVEFYRSLAINIETEFEYEDKFIVSTTDEYDNTITFEGQEASFFVNRYTPEKIREYFYFDGEQLHNYFLSEEDARIRDSVYTISQVDMLTRINDRLGKIINKKEKEAGKLSPDIDIINNEIMKIDSEIEEHKKSILELEEQITKSENVIKINSEYLRGQDNLPELEEKFQKLKEEVDQLEEERDDLSNELKSFISEYKVILSFYPIALRTLQIIIDKEKNHSLPPNIDKDLLLRMLSEHKCLVCGQGLNDNEEKKIRSTLEQILVSSETSHLLVNIKSELERIIEAGKNYEPIKKTLLKRVRNNEKHLNDVEIKLQNIDNEINKFTDKEKVKLWHSERSNHEKLLKINLQKLGVSKNQLDKSESELRKHQEKLTMALSQLGECSRLNEMILFTKNSRAIVKKMEEEMMLEVKHKMEVKTTNYFDDLVWKKNTYKCISLDNDYHLDLIHKEGYSCVGSCSAAERSLLALSFTLALHEVSGFKSLLFIDTPVARVSDVNRINFARVLKKVSESKQIILTFSPDEYSEEIRQIFESNVSTQVKLHTEEEKYTLVN